MYILLKTNEPEKIEIRNDNKKAHFFYAKNLKEAKMYLNELEDTNNSEYWSKYYADSNLKCCEEFKKYLYSTLLDSNKLTNKQIGNICLDFLSYIGYKNKKEPMVYFDNNISQNFAIHLDFEKEWLQLAYIIDRYTQTKNNIDRYYMYYDDKDFNPLEDLGLILPIINIDFRNRVAGALNSRFYKFIYFFDFLDIKIPNKRLRKFWNFYKKTMDLYSFNFYENSFYIVKKPDEIFIKDGITHCRYNTVEYYCDGISVPSWLYKAKKEELLPEDFAKIENVDVRTIFLKKAGIEKFISQGKIVDTFENYPDNELWAKSEYKLIDMKKILIKRYSNNNKTVRTSKYNYAPFLCMKNQTTSEYHLEGVSPDCKNLYDALKMRYKGLNLTEYDFKEIK